MGLLCLNFGVDTTGILNQAIGGADIVITFKDGKAPTKVYIPNDGDGGDGTPIPGGDGYIDVVANVLTISNADAIIWKNYYDSLADTPLQQAEGWQIKVKNG